ncbi:MAG: VCBS repeat-containing protein [candidate division Zixibacteria bacterium]|nr:VCBS repeat-containing protein [candidate division Zixibacteria bacterium]
MLRSKLFYLFFAILSLSFGLNQLWADEGLHFTRQNLKVNGEIVSKIYEDLNGDSLVDFIVFYSEGEDENSKRMVGFFEQQKGSGFDSIPNQTFELNKKASIVDLADINKDNKKELLFLADDGVYYYSLNGDSFNKEPSLLFSTNSFLPSSEENIAIWDFCPDFQDKGQMVIVPQKRGFEIWTRKEQGEFVRQDKLGFKPDISLSSSPGELNQKRGLIHFSYGIPGLIFTDYNKDGKEDILILKEDKIYVFLSKEDGSFGEQADKVLTLKPKDKKEENIDFKIEDINGDGIIDLAVNQSGGDLEKGFKSKTSIYLGKEGEGLNLDSPHQVISSEKEQSSLELYDLNKDGKKEMIVSGAGFNIGSMIKILLTKSVKLDFDVRSLGKNDIYPDQPNRKIKLNIKVSFGSSDEDNLAIDPSGDFNGDGLNDLFFAGGDNMLKFFLGRKGDFFADKPQYEMGIEIPTGNCKIIDLNNDNKSDIVFSFGEKKKDLKGKMVILFSKR